MNCLSLRNNEKGSVLLISYFLITVLIGLGAALALSSIGEKLVSDKEKKVIQAADIAEAGIEQAIYDLRQDFVATGATQNWTDGAVNGYAFTADGAYHNIAYTSSLTNINGGSFAVSLKSVAGKTDEILVKSTGNLSGINQTIETYLKMTSTSPWNNAIFAGAGASGAAVNGNVNIIGSVHILGTDLTSSDYAINMGGTAEIVGNNYRTLPASLSAKVPALPTVQFGGQTVSTLNATLRIKHGKVKLAGSSSVGEADNTGNTRKETIDGSYLSDGGYDPSPPTHVYSDNGWSNGYDLGDSVQFPSLSDPYPGYASYQDYLYHNSLVISNSADLNKFAAMTPKSNFTYPASGCATAANCIAIDGSGNMQIKGIVYLNGGGIKMDEQGSSKTINYTGKGSILTTGNSEINLKLYTAGNNSFPTNILGLMTPGTITFNNANIDVMGMFYGETSIVSAKQTNVAGSFVSKSFNMGTNVPAIFQVPTAASNLPPGLIGGSSAWSVKVISWQKL